MEVVDFKDFFEDFVENSVEEGNVDMVDIDSTESIFYRDFVLLVPKFEIDFENRAKVVAKNSNLVRVDYIADHVIVVFEVIAKAS